MNSSKKNVTETQKELLKKVLEEPTQANYWTVHKKIQKLDFSDVSIEENQRVKIALLSSFTIDSLKPFIDVDSRIEGLYPEIYVGPFNRFQEEVIDKKSELYKFNPEIIFFFIQLETLLPEDFKQKFAKISKKDLEEEIERMVDLIKNLLSTLTQNTSSLIVFSNFIVPTFSPLGILDNKKPIGFKRFYKMINYKLEELYQEDKQTFILDFDEIAATFGKDDYINYPMYYRGALLLSEKFLPKLSHTLLGYIRALKAKNSKCIVLDLDNTLWGGIIGEDGLDGIKLNINYPGNEFVDFQRTILSLYNRGIILAVNSKNNEADALEVFNKHPYMQIKDSHLASYRINWLDKVQNIIELAKDINIGLDSMVFFDDNPVERARIKESLPEVKVVDLPKSPALYKKTLEDLNYFDTYALTKEDLTRGEKYYKKRKRDEVRQQVQSIDDFIKTLELIAIMKQVDDFALPRVTSLINRTNQFNLTTKRYNEKEVQEIAKNSKEYNLYTLEVKDKFGEEGIVGVSLIKKESSKLWIIDTFLMSCRVIGRKIETAFLYKIINDAVKTKVEEIKAEFIPTKKNPLVKDFYQEHGFELIEESDDGSTKWSYKKLKKTIPYPKYLTVEEE
ncbi:MAG: HAD-IIIC family phosphatase [Asgard group archaeon]|nr:HAD-IIIC family phosphatase [Asgard group archaeon]